MTQTFFGNFDLASLALWIFWVFFALLIYYLQRENMREGYPVVDDDGGETNQGLFPIPEDKTFELPHGRGTLTVPSGQNAERAEIPLVRTSAAGGFPMEPVGDPMVGGVGPASWAPRRDVPELDGHGHNKLKPMRLLEEFRVATGRDPRGQPVLGGDGKLAGHIADTWIDVPEQLIRYLEIELEPELGGGRRLVPMTMARLFGGKAKVRALYALQFAGLPTLADPDQVTLLEEDKICGYCAGGLLYADPKRKQPLF